MKTNQIVFQQPEYIKPIIKPQRLHENDKNTTSWSMSRSSLVQFPNKMR